MISISMVACGGGDAPAEGDTSSSAAATTLEGKYLLSSMEVLGSELNYADLVLMEMAEGTYIEFSSDGTGSMAMEGESELGSVEYDLDAKTIVVEGQDATFEWDGDVFVLITTEPEIGESRMTFTKDGSSLWDEIMSQESELASLLDVFESPTTTLELGSEWYGTMTIENYTGPYDRGGVYDVTASIGGTVDETYFEVYDGSISGAISMYIELSDTYFTPIVNDEAWTFDYYLTEDDIYDLTPFFFNGALEFEYGYEYGGESFDVYIFLRETGTPWDESYDPLPPGYAEYAAEYGFGDGTSSGSETAAPATETEATTGLIVEHGPLTKAKLLEIYAAHTGSAGSQNGSFLGMTYDEVTAIFGEEPTLSTGGNHGENSYHYPAIDDDVASVAFLFEEENGVLECISVSKNFS